ncbi:histidine kinase [Micromonospora sp. M12]
MAILTVPLVGPVAAGRWPTWAWLGAALIGMTPLLVRWRAALAWTAGVLLVAVAVALWTGGSVPRHLAVAGGSGWVSPPSTGSSSGSGSCSWRRGRAAAQARLAAAEERLRFARDVHDVLGHSLTVIALKAELAARLAPVDPERAGREAAEVQRLAASALTEVRETVHGYRAVDLDEQLTAVVGCCAPAGAVHGAAPPADLPQPVAAELAAVLREAGTNVLRHSRADWCRIRIDREDDVARMTVTNDGADERGPDAHSHGLRGLADRLAAVGGGLRTHREDAVFTLEATVPVSS